MQIMLLKGLPGLLMIGFMIAVVLTLIVVLPTTFLLVLWNALVFESCGGPEISLLQASILWAAVLALLNWRLRPQWVFQFKNVRSPEELAKLAELSKQAKDLDSGNNPTPKLPKQK